MSRRIVLFGIGVSLLLLVLPAMPGSSFEITQPVHAQPDPSNVTVPGTRDSLAVTAVLRDGVAYAEIPERGRQDFFIDIEDHRVEGVGIAGGSVQVQCRATPETEDYRFWGFTQPGTRTMLNKGDTAQTRLSVFAQSMPSPEFFVLNVRCIGLGAMQGELITEFQVGVRVEPYMYMRLLTHPEFPPPTIRPDQDFTHKLILENRGNRDTFFRGEVEAPPGWQVRYPETVFVNAGERKEIEISGIAPAEKLYYRYESSLFDVTYWPDGQEDRGQSRSIPASVNGFYLHPALIPLILLAMTAVVLMGFIVVFARRTVEEQVLGKPMPPWRIPVEREHLKRLEQEDPDEFYVLRYHLMVEEHHSALLWYRHFKHATRKDRKLERKWLKKSDKVKNKTERLSNGQRQYKRFKARRLRVLPARRRRRLAALEKQLLASQWREQKNLLTVHKKTVKRIDKVHEKKVKKRKKQADVQFRKEQKAVEKANKKRIKQGDDPLPVPEEPTLEIPEPEFPDPVEVPLVAIRESSYATKRERRNRRFNTRIARHTKKAKRRMRKKKAKREKKANRLKRRLPAAPSTHMYDEDEFIAEEDVVIDDDRPLIHRVLNVPTLEKRDELRRRRQVYRAEIKKAVQQNDQQRVDRLKKSWQEEKLRLTGKSDGNKDETRKAAAGEGKEQAQKKGSATNEGSSPSQVSGGKSLLRLRRKKPEEGAGSASNQEGKEGDGPS